MADARVVATGVETSDIVVDEPLQPGRYFWQVTASDSTGDVSKPSSTASFEVLLPPAPVDLAAVENGKGRVDVSWTAQQSRFVYRVELSKTPDFAIVERTFEVKGNSDTLPRPLPGTWWMRARAIDDDGFAGPYGEPVMIELGPRPLWAVISLPSALLALALLL
ncbi:MAG: hypothetical protein R3C97_06550 [Geminicoccaceae bacterium]